MGVPVAYLTDRRVLTHPRVIFRAVWFLSCLVLLIVLCVSLSSVVDPLFSIVARAPQTLVSLSIVCLVPSTLLSVFVWVPLVSGLRRFFLPASLVLLALTGVFAFSYTAGFGTQAAQRRLLQVYYALARAESQYGPAFERPLLLMELIDGDEDGKYYWQGNAEIFFEWWNTMTTNQGTAVAWTGSIWIILSFVSVMLLYHDDSLVGLVRKEKSDAASDEERDDY
jgi:hypothetical protein